MRELLRLPFLALWLAAPVLHAGDFAVSGRFEYEDKAWQLGGWTGDDPLRPIRHADVTVLAADSQRVLGRGATDDEGEFSVECSSPSVVLDVVVRVDAASRMRAKGQSSFPVVRVENAFHDRYAAFSPVFANHPTHLQLDVGTTTVLKTVVSGREGNPFNLFDLAMAAFEYVTGPEVQMTRRAGTLTLVWPNLTGSFSMRRRAWIATSDGYDDAVVLHEIGHLVQGLYSDSDSPGGMHYFGDSDQDLRLAYGEGWATAFAGVVLERLGQPAVYLDADGAQQSGGEQLCMELESASPYQFSATGAGDEVAVACVLFDLLDAGTAGDGGSVLLDDDLMTSGVSIAGQTPTATWWELFTGPLKRARRVNVDHVWDAWVSGYDDPEYERLRDVFEARKLSFWADAAEPDGSPALARSVAPETWGTWTPEHTLYAAPPGALGPGNGDRDWFVVDLQAGSRVTIETRYPQGVLDAGTQVDPSLALFTPAGRLLRQDDDGGYRRNALLADVLVPQSGSYRFVVRSRNRLNRYGRYDLRVSVADD